MSIYGTDIANGHRTERTKHHGQILPGGEVRAEIDYRQIRFPRVREAQEWCVCVCLHGHLYTQIHGCTCFMCQSEFSGFGGV